MSRTVAVFDDVQGQGMKFLGDAQNASSHPIVTLTRTMISSPTLRWASATASTEITTPRLACVVTLAAYLVQVRPASPPCAPLGPCVACEMLCTAVRQMV